MGLLSAALYSPDARIGLLSDRGAFDQYARYQPGQIATDGGIAYICTAPVGTDAELEDTFQRPDQVGWGQSSHGEYWETSDSLSGVQPARVSGGRGILDLSSAGQSDGQLLGPSRSRGATDLLARLALTTPPSAHVAGVVLGLNTTEDGQQYAFAHLARHDDGSLHVSLQTVATDHEDAQTAAEEGPTATDAQDVWVRLRRIDLNYSVTCWVEGDAEPGTPQVTWTATAAQPAGHPYVAVSDNADGCVCSVGYLSVRPLTAATAPAGDTAHWTPLSEALAVPAPL